jgi:hypothetical protein
MVLNNNDIVSFNAMLSAIHKTCTSLTLPPIGIRDQSRRGMAYCKGHASPEIFSLVDMFLLSNIKQAKIKS